MFGHLKTTTTTTNNLILLNLLNLWISLWRQPLDFFFFFLVWQGSVGICLAFQVGASIYDWQNPTLLRYQLELPTRHTRRMHTSVDSHWSFLRILKWGKCGCYYVSDRFLCPPKVVSEYQIWGKKYTVWLQTAPFVYFKTFKVFFEEFWFGHFFRGRSKLIIFNGFQ